MMNEYRTEMMAFAKMELTGTDGCYSLRNCYCSNRLRSQRDVKNALTVRSAGGDEDLFGLL